MCCEPMLVSCVAMCLILDQPKRTHVTYLLIALHWLPVAGGIKLKSPTLAYRADTRLVLICRNSIIPVLLQYWWNKVPN